MKNYYRYLNLRDGAPMAEVKRRFRELSVVFHPDKNAGNLEAEKRYKEISEAYTYLKDPARKARLDSYIAYTRAPFQAANHQHREYARQTQAEERSESRNDSNAQGNDTGYTYAESRDKNGYREVENPWDFSELKWRARRLFRDSSFWLKLSLGIGMLVAVQMNRRNREFDRIKKGEVDIIVVDSLGNRDTVASQIRSLR